MLTKESRLRRKEEVDAVFRRGTVVSADDFILKFLPNGLPHSRVAVLVGKKVSNKANQRNRIRRRLREVVRLNFEKIPTGYDILIIVRSLKLRETAFPEITKKFLTILTRWINKKS
jgi:ribonuclease P protein component